jgi:hypothetical protein
MIPKFQYLKESKLSFIPMHILCDGWWSSLPTTLASPVGSALAATPSPLQQQIPSHLCLHLHPPQLASPEPPPHSRSKGSKVSGRSAHLPPPLASLAPKPPRPRPSVPPLSLLPSPSTVLLSPVAVERSCSVPSSLGQLAAGVIQILAPSTVLPLPSPCSCSHPAVSIHFLPQPKSDPLLPGVLCDSCWRGAPQVAAF